jgi:hypothetical protein
MRARTAFRLGQGIGALVAFAILILAFAWEGFLRLTSDAESKDLVLWSYDRDAAPGQTLEGRVWSAGPNIENVYVYQQIDADHVEILGNSFAESGHASNTLDFSFKVPDNVAPGSTLAVEYEVRTATDQPDIERRIPILTRAESMLRRIGKGALAIGCWAAVIALLFLLKRRGMRRVKDPSPLWLVPVVVAGGVSFVPLLEQATRLHGSLVFGLALAAWAVVAFAVAERLNRRLGLVRYHAEPLMIESAPDQPFRGAEVVAPIKPVEDVENAWIAVGMVVRHAGRDLIVTVPGGAFAVVPVPRSESFGGGPLVFQASDSELAELLVATASNVLGEMRLP